MTTTYQVSDKLGDAIFLVKTEHDDPGQAFGDFAQALSLIGNQQAEAILARLETTFGRGEAPLAAAVANAAPLVQPQPLANYVTPAPQLPAAAGGPGQPPTCQHGTKQYKQGEKNGRSWQAWACPGASSDPTRCGFEWIR